MAYLKDENGQTVQGVMADFYGTSSETKPTENIVNGSTFQEVDTGNFYFFNEDSSTWVKKNETGENRVETIQGTLNNIFGQLDVDAQEALWESINVNNANAMLSVDASILGEGVLVIPVIPVMYGDDYAFLVSSMSGGESVATGLSVLWAGTSIAGVLLTNAIRADINNGVGTITNLEEYSTLLPTTLTIYWHPMPQN